MPHLHRRIYTTTSDNGYVYYTNTFGNIIDSFCPFSSLSASGPHSLVAMYQNVNNLYTAGNTWDSGYSYYTTARTNIFSLGSFSSDKMELLITDENTGLNTLNVYGKNGIYYFELNGLIDPVTTVNIYNILGQKTKEIFNNTSINNSFMVYWDRKDDYGNVVRAGVYFVEIITENDRFVKSFAIIE
ncbi:T9SS type A sorting domain-containing protein [candidate division WOR-3 bacterium]|nr:T9SS type A sorting domain-containing protein [candidate division WOR-3 bacterium]